jgi:hypothetical protein
MIKVRKIAFFIFIVSFLFRIVLIIYTPSANNFADISCLVNGGQMITNGINPYKFDENKQLRNELRTDSIANNAWLCSTQELWNYHSANNLPFNLLFNGILDFFYRGDVSLYRYTYALIDSLIGYVATLFLFTIIQLPINWFSILFTLFISGLSPIIILNGTLVPEDKGFQVLLMLLALWFSINKNFFYACLTLSFSIGFKAVGAIIAPICLFYYILSKENFLKIKQWWMVVWELVNTNEKLKKSAEFTLLTLLLFSLFFLPYASDFMNIASQRILYEIDNAPNHSSLWILFYNLFPQDWATIRMVSLSILFSFLIIGFLTNLIPIDIFITSMLVMFLCVTFLTGSLDRNNMAMQPAIFIMALRWKKESIILGCYYGIGGALSMIPVLYKHLIDDGVEYAFYSSLFVLGYCILFYSIVIYKSTLVYFHKGSLQKEALINSK